MFGWFRPQCPVEPQEKVWIERRLAWLTEEFGLDRFRKATVLVPTEECFPEPFTGSVADGRRLWKQLCEHMEVPQRRAPVDWLDVRESRSTADDPTPLVKSIAHALARELLVGDRRMDGTVADLDPTADLLTVLLGLGVFSANAIVQESYQKIGGLSQSWQISTSGFLSERAFAYALALFAWARDEADPEWADHLRPNVQQPFQAGLRFLRRGTTLFRPSGQAPYFADLSDLRTVLRGSDAATRIAGLWELKSHGPAAAAFLDSVLPLVHDADPLIRGEAVKVLTCIGPLARRAVPELLDALQLEPTPEVRSAIVAALAVLKGDSKTVVPVLVRAVQKEESPWHYFVVFETYGPEATEAVPLLIEALAGNEYLAQQAIRVLAAIGPSARDAVPALLGILKDEGLLRADSARALGAIGRSSSRVVAALLRILRDKSFGSEERAAAALALGRLGAPAREATVDLRALRGDSDLDLRLHAAAALALGDGWTGGALQLFREVLPQPIGTSTTTLADRADAYQFIVEILPLLPDLVLAQLEQTLTDSDESARTFAAWALVRVGRPIASVTPRLTAALADPSPLVRALTAAALWIAGHPAEVVVPALVSAWRDAFDHPRREWFPALLRSFGEPATACLWQAIPGASLPMRKELSALLAALAVEAEGTLRFLRGLGQDLDGPLLEARREALEHHARLDLEGRKEKRRRWRCPPIVPSPKDWPVPHADVFAAIRGVFAANTCDSKQVQSRGAPSSPAITTQRKPSG